MSDIQLYLLEVDSQRAGAEAIAAQSAGKLERRELKLLDLISSLEPYINSKDHDSLRAKSIAYLADVLERVPPKVLTLQERRLLCDFLLGRIEGDAHGIGASARALLALEQRGKWDSDLAQRVMRCFLDHASPLSQFKAQTERYPVVQLIDLLLATYRNALKQLHESDPNFLRGLIALFEGEKDPRNLMIIFSLMRVPMAEWEVRESAQDLFDAVFNYFPITFKPPPDDPYGITAQHLKDRLRDCIAASAVFAPFAFPALLDKLDSSSINTKRDVLQTLQACIGNYTIATVNLYSVTLWDALKFEIFNSQEDELAEEALKILQLLGEKFATSEGPLSSYVRPIIKECNEHLEDAPTKQSAGSGKILYAVASSAFPPADKIAKGVSPALFSLLNASESITKRRGLFEVYNQITKAYLELQADGGAGSSDKEAVQAFASEALESMIRALSKAPKTEVSFRLTALAGISNVVRLRGVLSEHQITHAVDTITDIILHERTPGHGDISDRAMETIIEIAHGVPDIVRQQTVPAFMVELDSVTPDQHAYGSVVEIFAQLSHEQQLFDTVVLRLRNKLSSLRSEQSAIEYQRALLLGILYAFLYGSPLSEEGSIVSQYYSDCAAPILDQLKEVSHSGANDSITETVGRIVNITLRQQTPHFQSTVYNTNQGWLGPLCNDTNMAPLRAFAPFSLYYYAALRPEIVETSDISLLLQAQAHYLLSSDRDVTGEAPILRHMSLLVNKFLDPGRMEASLEHAGLEVRSLLNGDLSAQRVHIAFAVVKALIVQGKCGSLTSRYLALLLEILPRGEEYFAECFAALLAPDDILMKENHCSISNLYRQRTYSHTVPLLIESIRLAQAPAKTRFLIALSGLLRWLPFPVLEPALPDLVPPLLQSLDVTAKTNQQVKYTALTIFESLLMHRPETASEHISSLVSRLLNSTSTPGNAAILRVKALQCLLLAPKQLKQETVMPYRRPVAKKLLGCLDDPKRDVRAEAVRCRSAWLALEDGNEQDEG